MLNKNRLRFYTFINVIYIQINAKKIIFVYYNNVMTENLERKKFNIFKTFEIFLREPLSLLRDKLIQIVNINSTITNQTSLSVGLLNNKAQITVVNSEKMYKLLKNVQRKQEEKAVEKLLIPSKKNQVVLGQLFGRT